MATSTVMSRICICPDGRGNNSGRLIIRRMLLLMVFAIAMAAAGQHAQAAAKEEELDELEEVVVQGKNIAEEIVKAETEYYALFNDLNKDDRYDTHCVFLKLETGSSMESRVCIPGFVADAMADWAPFKARCQPPVEPGQDEFDCLDRSRNGRISMDEASARIELASEFMTLDADQNGSLDRTEFPLDLPPPTAVYQPPAPEMVLMEGSKRWYDHMMQVTKSDPRLMKMADNLGGLYQDLAATQRRYDKLDTEAKLRNKKDMKGVGPRGR